MAETRRPFIAEFRSAMRGIVALLGGDRAAPRYFDFSPAGVAGSFVPVLVVAVLEMIEQMAIGMAAPGDITRSAVQTGIIYAVFIGSTALLLLAIGRRDAFRPFLVTYNWVNAALTMVIGLLMMAGFMVAMALAFVGTLVMIINIGRLIMTLKPGQVAMLLITQVIGGAVSLLIISSLYAVPLS